MLGLREELRPALPVLAGLVVGLVVLALVAVAATAGSDEAVVAGWRVSEAGDCDAVVISRQYARMEAGNA